MNGCGKQRRKIYGKFKNLFFEVDHDMHEHQRLTTGGFGFHEASTAMDIGTTLKNLSNETTTDQYIV